jgi:hypothetical protein
MTRGVPGGGGTQSDPAFATLETAGDRVYDTSWRLGLLLTRHQSGTTTARARSFIGH